MASSCKLNRVNRSIWTDPSHREALVCGAPVFREIKSMLDKQRSDVGIVTDPVPSNPRVHQRKRKEKQYEKNLDVSILRVRLVWGLHRRIVRLGMCRQRGLSYLTHYIDLVITSPGDSIFS